MDTQIHLGERLAALATTLQDHAPTDEQGAAATLSGLLACEPAVGPVVVIVWETADGALLYELAKLDGTKLADAVALREAFVLLAMTEALEEQLAPLVLRDVIDQLIAWQEAVRAARESGYTPGMVEQDAVTTALWKSVEQLQLLEIEVAALEDGEVRMARPQRLDKLGGMLRELERTWEQLESAAAKWIDAIGDAESPLVGQLWTTLAAARRGPLAAPVSSVIEQGRRSGMALAEEALAGAGN